VRQGGGKVVGYLLVWVDEAVVGACGWIRRLGEGVVDGLWRWASEVAGGKGVV